MDENLFDENFSIVLVGFFTRMFTVYAVLSERINCSRCKRSKDSFRDLKINNEDCIKLKVINNKGEKLLCLGNSAMKSIIQWQGIFLFENWHVRETGCGTAKSCRSASGSYAALIG